MVVKNQSVVLVTGGTVVNHGKFGLSACLLRYLWSSAGAVVISGPSVGAGGSRSEPLEFSAVKTDGEEPVIFGSSGIGVLFSCAQLVGEVEIAVSKVVLFWGVTVSMYPGLTVASSSGVDVTEGAVLVDNPGDSKFSEPERPLCHSVAVLEYTGG